VIKRIWIMTLFPEMFKPFLECGVAGAAFRGAREGDIKFEIKFVNIRDYSTTKYKSVDDSPYGGGPGMVMRADILKDALIKGVVEIGGYQSLSELEVIYTSPRGKVWNAQVAREFGQTQLSTTSKDLVFIAGRYEGIDERFLSLYVNSYYSIGDYVLTGGEIAIMSMLDSAVRFLPGVLGNNLSSAADSFEDGLIEYPQYTKPREFDGLDVPSVLLEGHHKKIIEWQDEQKVQMTKKFRPDLIK
jgi:tRNA (guanine37-N1)-methyltransferase